MLKKSAFFDFLNRRSDLGFAEFVQNHVADEHYIDWNGFVLPNEYRDGDAEHEYQSIRKHCALCDVSPMRKIRIEGRESGSFLDHLLTRPVSKLPAMRATYVVFCNDDGTLKDDAILYKFGAYDYLLMPSDVDHTPYFESVCARFEIDQVSFTECTDAWVGLAIQGPKSARALDAMGFKGVDQLAPFAVIDFDADAQTVKVSRMGFTADLGYELWCPPEMTSAIIQRIDSAREQTGLELPGYGLDALQACRIEGGFIVAGWDCATEIEPQPGFERSPFELGLGWLVNLGADDFVGRRALQEERDNGPKFTLRSFACDTRCKIDDGCDLFEHNGAVGDAIGIVTCSSWSWGMQTLLGNASIKTTHADIKTAVAVVNGKQIPITLSPGPSVELSRRSQVPAPM